ncbi:MAG: Uma2 family endonuclease [Bacteroidota bacterium]
MASVVEKSAYEKERNKPMPSKNHAIVQTNLVIGLAKILDADFNILTEIALSFPTGDRIPDLAIFESIDFTPGHDEIRMKVMPKGIIEILSSTQSLNDLTSKAAEYFSAGVISYWLVLPDLCSIYVFSAPNEYNVFIKDQTLNDPVLGLELPLTRIFF